MWKDESARPTYKETIGPGRGGGLVDRAPDSGPCGPSSIPIGVKKENKQKRDRGWPI